MTQSQASRPAQTSEPAPDPTRADGVFEGGGVKGLAFAGALAAAEEAGIERWVNVAGTSAGAIVAALVAAGYDASGLKSVLETTDYTEFADYGFGGKLVGGARNALRRPGIVRGEHFRKWLGERFEASPLGKAEPTFADVERTDLPAGLSDEQREKARYRLKVIASDISEGRMLVLPDDIGEYAPGPDQPNYDPHTFPLVDAVRMSMSFPYFFPPVTLYRNGRAHLIVDGGLLSNFPIWLFDSPDPIKRRTYGFRLHPGEGLEAPPYRSVKGRLWPLPLTKAMFMAATEAWDRRMMANTTAVRTVSIPTGDVGTLAFELTDAQRDGLYASGLNCARAFFAELDDRDYVNTFGRRSVGTAAAAR